MKKSTLKLISIITIILCVIMSMSTCFAAVTANQITGNDANVDTNTIGTIGNKIATIIRNVGVVVAVIMLMVIGLKYMMGSAEEKAEYKKVIIPYLVGAVLLFAAALIAQAVISFSSFSS